MGATTVGVQIFAVAIAVRRRIAVVLSHGMFQDVMSRALVIGTATSFIYRRRKLQSPGVSMSAFVSQAKRGGQSFSDRESLRSLLSKTAVGARKRAMSSKSRFAAGDAEELVDEGRGARLRRGRAGLRRSADILILHSGRQGTAAVAARQRRTPQCPQRAAGGGPGRHHQLTLGFRC